MSGTVEGPSGGWCLFTSSRAQSLPSRLKSGMQFLDRVVLVGSLGGNGVGESLGKASGLEHEVIVLSDVGT